MKTYFARHTEKLDVDVATRQILWDSHLVAIHYPEVEDGRLGPEDSESLNPAASGSRAGKAALGALVELSEDGGYVCAQYYGKESVLVGKIPPATPIQLIRGRWGLRSFPEGRTAILKAVPLMKVRVLHPHEHALILAGRPRQGTLSRWGRAGHLIEDLVEERRPALALESLSPAQQETLCGEYMRSVEAETDGLPRLMHLLLPVGRTLKDIDILGVATDGEAIFAQVTSLDFGAARGKLRRLAHYRAGSGTHLVLFCDHTHPERIDGVSVYPIRQAFDRFRSSPGGKVWLRQALAATTLGTDTV